jgi:hypothetical protein
MENPSSYGSARSVGEHSRSNVHRLEFLEQELCSVWDVNLGNLCLVLARSAFKRLFRKISANTCQSCLDKAYLGIGVDLRNWGHESTNLANMNTERIGNLK